MADQETDIFNIGLDDSDVEAAPPSPKQPRDYQSYEDWLAQKEAWRPKVELGENYKTLMALPIDQPNKMDSQKILHAIEELYYFGNYPKALEITRQALKGDLDKNYRADLEDFERRCQRRIDAGKA